MKVGSIVAGVASALGALIAAYDGVWQFSLVLTLPTALLFLAILTDRPRLQLAAQLVLIIELLILGGIWPSLATLAALLALPSPVLGIVYMIKGQSPRRGQLYILASTLLASAFLLFEAIVLATAQR